LYKFSVMSVNSSAKSSATRSRQGPSSIGASNSRKRTRQVLVSSDEEDDDPEDENYDDNDEDCDEEVNEKEATQDLIDFPNLHESFRDSGILHVVQMMKRENGGITYVLPYRSEFERIVKNYKEDGDEEFIDQLFAFISILCLDRVHTAGVLKGTYNRLIFKVCAYIYVVYD